MVAFYQDLLDRPPRGKWYFLLSPSFWSTSIAQRSRYKIVFTHRGQQFEWTHLPQGFQKSLLFQASVTKILKLLLGTEQVLVCSGIVVAFETEGKHKGVLAHLFILLSQASLKLNGKKAQMARERVFYL